MAKEVRQPVQKRSIETKNKIIRAAYDIFSETGYFNTNTAEIAKYAGVSTGIVYGYFKNKRDIMLEVVDLYIANVYDPIINMFDKHYEKSDLEKLVEDLLCAVVAAHRDNARIHEALNSLTHTDPLVMARFDELEEVVNKKLVTKFIEAGYKFDDIYERVHIVLNLMQSYSHEAIFADHDYVDNKKMYEIVKSILIGLFK